MTILYENFTGNDLNGTDKTANRALNSERIPKFIVVERKTLRPEIDYEVNVREITFKIVMDNRWRITVFSSLGASQRAPAPLFMFADLSIELKASVKKTAGISIGFSFFIEKEVSLEIDLFSAVSKEADININLTANISKDASKTVIIKTELDHSLLADIVEML